LRSDNDGTGAVLYASGPDDDGADRHGISSSMRLIGPETYLSDILAKIAEGHPINRIDELVPRRMIPAATASPL